jgi:hypothetical protein
MLDALMRKSSPDTEKTALRYRLRMCIGLVHYPGWLCAIPSLKLHFQQAHDSLAVHLDDLQTKISKTLSGESRAE